jgi:hypothetical protein
MTTPAVDCLQVTWKDAIRILPLGLALGGCYGMFFGWLAGGFGGLMTLAVLERAAKTGIAVSIGFFVTGKVAGRLAFSSLYGAICGAVFAAVYDQPPLALLFGTVVGAGFVGILSRLGLLPGESTQPHGIVDSDIGNQELRGRTGPSQTDTPEL